MDVDEVVWFLHPHPEMLCIFLLHLLIFFITGIFYLFFIFLLTFLLQVECIMSILIYKNLVKGYFAHKSKVVVLSKQDPFPKLNGKPVNS